MLPVAARSECGFFSGMPETAARSQTNAAKVLAFPGSRSSGL